MLDQPARLAEPVEDLEESMEKDEPGELLCIEVDP